MAWARASELHRVLECPASADGVLPRSPDSPGKAARWGTEVHAWKAAGGEPEPGEFGHLIKKRLMILTGTPHGEELREEFWPAELGEHEYTFAVRPDGSVIRAPPGLSKEQQDQWKRDRPDDEWTGSSDWVGDSLGRPWVDDLKTGREPSDPAGPQFHAYGVGLGVVGGVTPQAEEGDSVLGPRTPGDTRVSLTCTHWPQYPNSNRPDRYEAETTVDRLRRFQARIEKTRQRVEKLKQLVKRGGTPPVNPGEHCQWCPCYAHCPNNQETE